MKKLILSFAAAAMIFTSCSQNDLFGTSSDDAVNVKIALSTPDLMSTRAYSAGARSDKGGLTNVNFDEVDLRYILEIWDANGTQCLKTFPAQIYDKSQDAYFEFRLAPNREYKFVAWADFVKQDETTDNHYNTEAGLSDIKIGVTGHAINDETRDAYFASTNLTITPTSNAKITLKRPFGKVRAIATDMLELTSDIVPTKVSITYTNHKPIAFNAVDGTYTQGPAQEQTLTAQLPATKEYKEAEDKEDTNHTLFVDYIMARSEVDQNLDAVPFTLTTYDQDNVAIRTHSFTTQIPCHRNCLTTITGNLLTIGTGLTIEIDEDFDDFHDINVQD